MQNLTCFFNTTIANLTEIGSLTNFNGLSTWGTDGNSPWRNDYSLVDFTV